ncbi:MAG TPA: hypothetical protein VMV54_03040 [Acidocella sp.]|nr:hypothetical protein [Acidocella sp.]
MSYLDTGKARFKWIVPIAHTSTRQQAGCVQCGSRLDAPEYGKRNMTGKCFNCAGWVSDEEEVFDELDY